jgi:preprotein translocase subunit SecB
MKKPEISKFQFDNFVVLESRFLIVERGDYEFSFEFTPSGKVYPSLGQFELYLNLQVREKNNLLEIDVRTVSYFTFEEEGLLAENKFFTTNAPAIVYPYIRAYIATLTAQSGVGTITMPSMNLTPLGDILRESISVES